MPSKQIQALRLYRLKKLSSKCYYHKLGDTSKFYWVNFIVAYWSRKLWIGKNNLMVTWNVLAPFTLFYPIYLPLMGSDDEDTLHQMAWLIKDQTDINKWGFASHKWTGWVKKRRFLLIEDSGGEQRKKILD